MTFWDFVDRHIVFAVFALVVWLVVSAMALLVADTAWTNWLNSRGDK